MKTLAQSVDYLRKLSFTNDINVTMNMTAYMYNTLPSDIHVAVLTQEDYVCLHAREMKLWGIATAQGLHDCYAGVFDVYAYYDDYYYVVPRDDKAKASINEMLHYYLYRQTPLATMIETIARLSSYSNLGDIQSAAIRGGYDDDAIKHIVEAYLDSI